MHTQGNWKPSPAGSEGALYSAVVTDIVPADYKDNSGHNDINAYGGFLICESVRKNDLQIIAAAPELLQSVKALFSHASIIINANHPDYREAERLIQLLSKPTNQTNMKLSLQSIHLRNFKGVFQSDITFNGQSADIFGANESQKSTHYSAFLWCLTGKDEFDRKDYEIKNTVHPELNRNPHEVGLSFTSGDKLKRTYLEKWVRQKGAEQATFTGHVTEYTYNDVPCSATEYQARVDALIKPTIIKLVTNPMFFNSLNWDVQRKGLMQIAGEISAMDIVATIKTPDRNFASLAAVLNSKEPLDDYKKRLASKKKLLKDSAVQYAPRIDEAKRNKPEAKDWARIEQGIKQAEDEISGIEASLSDASKALGLKQAAILALQQQAFEKEQAITAIRNKTKAEIAAENTGDHSKEIAQLERQISQHNAEAVRLQGLIAKDATNKAVYAGQIANKQAEVARIRADWDTINAEKFVMDTDKCECPTCKRAFDADKIEEVTKDLQKNFNQDVIKRKGAKVERSNIVKAEIKQYEENIAAINAHDYAALILAEQAEIGILQEQITAYRLQDASVVKVDVVKELNERMGVNDEAIQLTVALTALQAEIATLTAAIGDTSNEPVLASKRAIQLKLDGLHSELGVKKAIESTDKRIKELLDEERTNAVEIARIEQLEFDIETYTRARMDVLQSKVNGMFKYVQWRLFEVQVNGAIAETCVCEYNGVPYPTLNTAAKLLAGLDVLNTLSKFYDCYAPVWCDNRESVTWIPQSESQVISLLVRPEDEVMRVKLI